MEQTQSKKRDHSLLFMAVVIVATFLLTGCNLTNSDSTATSESASAGEIEVAKTSKIIPEARADYEEGEFQPYSEEAYRKAISDNKKVFIYFHADWCPVCVSNAPVLKESFDAAFMDNVVGFEADFDEEKSLEAELGVSSQATLILFQGSDELARAMGPQTSESLKAFIKNEVVEEAEEVSLKEPVETQVAASSSYELGTLQAFSKERFDDATADGKTVLLDFHADWCHVCRGNEPIVKSALQSSGDVVGLRVNYDTAHDLRAKYGVVAQSTYIVLQGGKELGRTLGPQSSDTMSKLLSI